tara:strand:- start:214 stop:360 length:147 start_codon:yes stop_codon:yes gene_type:complete
MKLEIVPLAGFIFGILIFDSKWENKTEGSYFEVIFCIGILGIKFVWLD